MSVSKEDAKRRLNYLRAQMLRAIFGNPRTLFEDQEDDLAALPSAWTGIGRGQRFHGLRLAGNEPGSGRLRDFLKND